MTITLTILVLCLAGFATYCLSGNGRIQAVGLAVFTAALAAVLIEGPRWIR